jgi:phage gp36-like protein
MYCTIEDIIGNIPEKTVRELTSDSDSDTVNVDIVNAKINERGTYIDSYLNNQYTLPITNAQDLSILKSICIELVIFELYKRKHQYEITDTMMFNYNNTISILKEIQSGKKTLFTGHSTKSSSCIIVSKRRDNLREIERIWQI